MSTIVVDVEITIDPRKIEVVARMMTHATGRDPDEKVSAPFFADGREVPAWHLQVDSARRFIAGYETMRQIENV